MLEAGLIIIIWMFSICFHEFGHAVVAYWGGDRSVKDKGYLTFNPFAYTDIGMTLILPTLVLLIGGIALPGAAVYINTSALRNRLWQSAVSLAGPIGTAIATAVIAIAYEVVVPLVKAGHEDLIWLIPSLAFLLWIHGIVFFLNLIPLPPLDGWGIVEPWLPAAVRERTRKSAGIGLLILIGLLWFVPPAYELLWDGGYLVTDFVGAPRQLVKVGMAVFQKNALNIALILIAGMWLFRKRRK